MPDTRRHRGAHPEDAELFSPDHWPALRAAAADLCWLLDRGYAVRSALALTGDRHALTQRQRLALSRCVCSQAQAERRAAHRCEPADLAGRPLWVDGYNLLIITESALSGGVILGGRDGCYRDMASLHGTYREVSETTRAIELIGATAAGWGVASVGWFLDRPVGNSGRLKAELLEIAGRRGWDWQVELVYSPDRVLSTAEPVVASSDSVILDCCHAWCNAARAIISASVPDAFVLHLGWPETACSPPPRDLDAQAAAKHP